MEWAKVKNIIILILITVNVFLLVLTVGREREARQYREEARAGAVEVLRRQGYTVAEDALPPDRHMVSMSAEREREQEEKLAQRLLGTAEKTEDSVRVSYKGEKGTCAFRGDGEFTFTFHAGAYPVSGSMGKHAVKLLGDAGYSCVVLAEDGETVTVRQVWEEMPLFSCTAELRYEGGELVAIEGRRLIGTPAEEGGENVMDVATALIRFVGGMREGGHVFTTVERLTAGYRAESSGRRMHLEPVWSVETDAGVFRMNAVTGALNPE